MEHAPEEYGEYWGGAVRIAAGVLFSILTYRLVGPFLAHPAWPARLLGWFVFGGAVLVGSFAVSLGLAKVVGAAS